MKKMVNAGLIILLIGGVSFYFLQNFGSSSQEIIPPKIEYIDPDENDIVIHYMADTMDRGNHEYSGKYIVIDPHYYNNHPIERGDVILVNTDQGTDLIFRVVGLPGEKLQIIHSQIYINDKKLDTYYGEFHRLGKNIEDLKREYSMSQDSNISHLIEQTQNYITNEIHLSNEQYYVIGDDWFRSPNMNPVTKTDIIGKVLGYSTESMLQN
jgi:signal peptidase I